MTNLLSDMFIHHVDIGLVDRHTPSREKKMRGRKRKRPEGERGGGGGKGDLCANADP